MSVKLGYLKLYFKNVMCKEISESGYLRNFLEDGVRRSDIILTLINAKSFQQTILLMIDAG